MASKSLITWRTGGSHALDEIESAHRAVGGKGPGRRYATQQINQAYAVMLCSQFQRFCRDLHSEAAAALVSRIPDARIREIVVDALTAERKLDRGNPNPGNIGADFWRFDLDLWKALHVRSPRNSARQLGLHDLNTWRNAIAHLDFTSPRLTSGGVLRLSQVRVWRRTCNVLAAEIDGAVANHMATIIGVRPW